MKSLDKEENDLLESIEKGEWVSESKIETYELAAKNYFKKNQKISLRINEHDLKSVQKKAALAGIPYQTLITSIIHKYVTGKMIET